MGNYTKANPPAEGSLIAVTLKVIGKKCGMIQKGYFVKMNEDYIYISELQNMTKVVKIGLPMVISIDTHDNFRDVCTEQF